jgi:trimeric autotransporter adhesin
MASAWVLALGLSAGPLYGQLISTFAGTIGLYDPKSSVPALSASLGNLAGVAVDAQGNVYAADSGNQIVVQITPAGVLTVVAGNGNAGLSGDGGTAGSASLNYPHAVTVDPLGSIYIADTYNNLIRQVSNFIPSVSGTIATFAGNGAGAFAGDGGPAPGGQFPQPFGASLNSPQGVATDSKGNLYIADTLNNRIRMVSGGTISTFAGNGAPEFSGDGGLATAASLNQPMGVAVDAAGNVYIADTGNNRIRMVTKGTIATLAGDGVPGFSNGVSATTAALQFPQGVAVDSKGNVFIADTANNCIREVSGGTIATVAGTTSPTPGFSGDGGPATSASLSSPQGVAVDSGGNVYIADTGNGRIRKVSGGTIATIAGSGSFRFSGDGNPANAATLSDPQRVAVDSQGNVYIADTGNNRVRRVSGGTIATVAGNGNQGFSGDTGLATAASLNSPLGLTVDSSGNLYIADTGNNRVRMVTPTGIITTVAGSGKPGFAGDGGTATTAFLNQPSGVAVDPTGNLYIADKLNNRIRIVTPDGKIETFAGTGFSQFSGDGGLAANAALFWPTALAAFYGSNVESGISLYIADYYNNRIRVISPKGIITTVAGNGGQFPACGSQPQPATATAILHPTSVAVDSGGNVFIAEPNGNQICEVSMGQSSTVAGNGNPFSGPGPDPLHPYGDGSPAIDAILNDPEGVAVDSAGNIYIADSGNDFIRKVSATALTFQVKPAGLTFSLIAGGPTSTEILTLSSASSSIPLSFTASASTAASDGNWLTVQPPNGSIQGKISVEVIADPSNLNAGVYSGQITIQSPYASPPTVQVTVTLTVLPGVSPMMSIGTGNLSFSAIQGGSAPPQQVSVFNTGSGTLSFSASATTNSGGSWLSVPSATGTATPTLPGAFTVVVTPGTLAPGTYTGAITVVNTGDGSSVSVAVTLSVIPPSVVMALSETGLSFSTAQGGGAPLPLSFGILNTGQGAMSWTAAASTLTGGNWLLISQPSGTVTQPLVSVSQLTVSVDPVTLSTLLPGTYYGQIQVSSATAVNSPQAMTVILNVLPVGSALVPQVLPGGLMFTGTAGINPGSQEISIGNPTATTQTYSSSQIGAWYSYKQPSANVPPNQPAGLQVYPNFTSATPGDVEQGTITLAFMDGTSLTIATLLVAAPSSSNSAANCASQAQMVFRSLLEHFTVTVGQPATLELQLADGCGNPVGPGASVTVGFSNGDNQAQLTSIGGGIWQGTWLPIYTGQVFLSVTALLAGGNGSLTLVGAPDGTVNPASPNSVTPVIASVTNSASNQSVGTIAPGELITIYGSNLAASAMSASLPWPDQMAGTQVFVGGLPLPMQYAAPGQLNLQVPYGLTPGGNAQFTVQQGNAYSIPLSVVVAAAQPAIFTSDQSGSGQGLIYQSDMITLAAAGTPATAGDTVAILCSGLGAVAPPVPEGTAPPTPPSSSTVLPIVTIGGQQAQVSSSGLAPGVAGWYQVNAIVPSGITPGNAVPVVLNIAGQSSQANPPVTMAVR